GKEWISCYGAEGIQTPNIDRLAKTGMKFNNAWCMPQCTPTRVTLLTGQYPFRHGWTNHWDVPRWGAGAHFDANQNTSYAAVLRDAGYATCAAGKWQIDDFRVEPDAMDQAGFDDWCMWTGAEGGNRVSGERYWDAYINVKGQASKTYSGQFGPDVYCNHLIDFIGRNQQQPNRKPMLLYFPMALTHGPLTTTADNRDDAKTKQLFAGMVRYTDKLVGRLIAAIDNAGIRDNTLIVFTTDNGTGGNRNKRLGRMVRGGKAKMTEQNGTAQPFIVNCPGMVPAGVSTDALVDFTDILPTFAELGGATLPPNRIVDGKSFASLILGKSDDSQRSWIMSMGGGPAILAGGRVRPRLDYDDRVLRTKRYKLWIDPNRNPIKLFDLQSDPWEENNLIESSDPQVIKAKETLIGVAAGFPKNDGAPIYKKNPPQPWDKK
ncbi:MAG: sulfatase-like hydrolase/transferase, partial [Planctomycetota bacterium]